MFTLKSQIIVIFLLIILKLTYAYNFKQIPEGYSLLIDGHSYKLYASELNWLDAYKKCQEDGAHLIVIDSVEEIELITNFITKGNETFYAVWAGVITTRISNFYIDFEGNAVQEKFWGPGEPDDAGGDYFCGEAKQDGLYGLYNCANLRAFICEFE